MTPEMQKKMEELLVSDDCGMFSSPERWVGFRRGFKAAHDLMQEQVKPLIKAAMWFAHNPPPHFDDCQSFYEDDEKCICGAESRHDDLVAALKEWEE